MSIITKLEEWDTVRKEIKSALNNHGVDVNAIPFSQYAEKINESPLMILDLDNTIFAEQGKNGTQTYNLTIDVDAKIKMIVAWGDATTGLTKDDIVVSGVIGGVTIPLTEENGDFLIMGSDFSHTKIWINNGALKDGFFGYVQLQSDSAFEGARAKVYVFK